MKPRTARLVAVAILVLVVVWALSRTTSRRSGPVVVEHRPQGIMGTGCKLALVAEESQTDSASHHLELAEAELRRLESMLSTWIDSSELSLFNAAPGQHPIALAPEVLEVLRAARDLHSATSNTFDITTRPLLEVWRRAESTGQLPTTTQLQEARAESSWDQIQISTEGAVKSLGSTRVDVDGIAKGYGIDRALEILRRSGAAGGLVEVGGDLSLFGTGPTGQTWKVAIQSPFVPRPWAEIEIEEGAVCTSGNYARYLEIGDRRFSQILDPRTGKPTAASLTVTVVGPDALTADAWATALSVLGPAGLELLDDRPGLEAMIVTGVAAEHQVLATPGFRRRLVRAEFALSN